MVGPAAARGRVHRRNALVGVLDKPSEFAERAVHEWTGAGLPRRRRAVLSAQYRLMIRTERTKAREQKKYDDIELEPYTDERDRGDRRPVRRRAAARRRAALVGGRAVGDEVGPMVKGPLTVTDMVCWHVGMGMGLYGVKPLRLGYKNRSGSRASSIATTSTCPT